MDLKGEQTAWTTDAPICHPEPAEQKRSVECCGEALLVVLALANAVARGIECAVTALVTSNDDVPVKRSLD